MRSGWERAGSRCTGEAWPKSRAQNRPPPKPALRSPAPSQRRCFEHFSLDPNPACQYSRIGPRHASHNVKPGRPVCSPGTGPPCRTRARAPDVGTRHPAPGRPAPWVSSSCKPGCAPAVLTPGYAGRRLLKPERGGSVLLCVPAWPPPPGPPGGTHGAGAAGRSSDPQAGGAPGRMRAPLRRPQGPGRKRVTRTSGHLGESRVPASSVGASGRRASGRRRGQGAGPWRSCGGS